MANQAQGQGAADQKKKIMMVVGGIIGALVVWQVIGMMGSSSPAPTPGAKTPAGMANKSGKPGTPNAGAPGQMAGASSPDEETPKSVPVVANPQIDALQKENEAKYLKALNELQMLKVQKEISSANKDIAKDKVETVQAEKQVTDLVTVKPVNPSESEYANMLNNNSGSAAAQGGTGAKQDSQNLLSLLQQNPQAKKAAQSITQQVMSSPYVVLSVSQQDNKWTAVLGNAGKLYSVGTGDTLASDGSVVESINRDGVILAKDGMKAKIPISAEF